MRRDNPVGRIKLKLRWTGIPDLLPSVYCLLPTAFCLLLTAHCTLPNVTAQVPQGNSPLYSSRPYEARAPSGLPKALNGVGIDQKLNQQLPLDLELKNENGETVKLGNYFGRKPVMLSLVYYECPMLCNQVLNGMVTAFRVMSFTPGNEFDVVTISFDPGRRRRWLLRKRKPTSNICRKRNGPTPMRDGIS